jgi:hypothetical protein
MPQTIRRGWTCQALPALPSASQRRHASALRATEMLPPALRVCAKAPRAALNPHNERKRHANDVRCRASYRVVRYAARNTPHTVNSGTQNVIPQGE